MAPALNVPSPAAPVSPEAVESARQTAPTSASRGPLGAEAAEVVIAPLDFAAVYEAWFPTVCRWAAALGGPRADVEDVAQEVFLVVRRKLPDFDGENLGGWLYRITAGKVRDARRLAWVRHLFLGEAPGPDRREERPGPVELLERKDDERRLYRLLDRMSDKRRRALVLAELEGCSGEEIARLEGIPVATARTRLHHARREFVALAATLRAEEP
jgi:RNA polymerase sigma-70 factor (ECF subfamily)